MNEKWIECRGYEDTYREATQIDKARIKRLKEDRDKDEANKLLELKKAFIFDLRMTKEQYDKEVTNFRGKDLITFYYRMEDKYGKYNRRLKPVPKFS
jgi:NAD+--asparagine ADP-ribosyltransferase